jgi:hypothetical protein
MYRILQNYSVKIQLLIFLLYLFVGCATTTKSTDFLKNKYGLQELCNGIEITKHNIDFFYYPVYNLNNNEVDADYFLNNHKYQLIITCSPYLCGGCKRTNTELVNYFTKKYPGQVKFIVENWYIIIDEDNHIRYLVVKSYYCQPDELQWGKIINKIEEYLKTN